MKPINSQDALLPVTVSSSPALLTETSKLSYMAPFPPTTVSQIVEAVQSSLAADRAAEQPAEHES